MYGNSADGQTPNPEGKVLKDREDDQAKPGSTTDPLTNLGGNGRDGGDGDDSDNG